MKRTPSQRLAAAALLTLTTLLASGSLLAQENTEQVRVTARALDDVLSQPQYSAPATVESLNETQLSALLNAQIIAVNVRPGDSITQGQTLVELDCSDARLALENAEAQQELAQKEFNRLSKLRQSSVATEQQFNTAQTNLRQARVASRQAQLQISRCEVNAPFDGVVTARQASLGALAAPGTPLLTLVDLSRLEVSAQISTSDLDSLKDADALVFDDGRQQVPVTLRSLSPVINPTSRNSEARMTFTGETAPAGASGRLRWQGATGVIPADLLLERGGKLGVFVAEGNTARFVALPSARAGQAARTELPAETQLIIDGRFGLNDGDRIEVQGL